ncbi:F0F1 ATP synthase subunit delta [Plasticicumulans acidivorans]|uniref:ATP synthase subunit delta n=1 Tax=Plasticicumulans acidivorans TaxID=886464 RepID=A0A317MVP2_9GAMM|nr:F0F1 ATP synthase subunit delta [Plasticicumulans acidivorans]PWV62371.1 ATP synthase F1 subcomplex delta subunit [Plasticicumulans acidivorans]
MAETTTVARPYARAAFEHAKGKKSGLKKWSELLTVLATVVHDTAMQAAISSPALSFEDKAGLVLDVCRATVGDKAVSEDFVNFVRLLAENRRLETVTEIAALYEMLKAEAEKSIKAEVRSAFELDDAQKAKIAEALKQRLQRDVDVDVVVDESLLGGAIIRAGDVVIDGSARGQLAKFATALRQ